MTPTSTSTQRRAAKRLKFEAAKLYCRDENADLASIHSSNENRVLLELTFGPGSVVSHLKKSHTPPWLKHCVEVSPGAKFGCFDFGCFVRKRLI
ncbi:hypothetical protein L596_010196 [Steinernema carpocapsae]|uniref:C-type lectin domain-containing protein n=1 Tax=Steinernema carpocapsae TaxID=34508 RepID=A0A4U5PI35_STECR|nr:hypothetical protein L596_010196 [Steinernema carpocapsae]